MKKFLEKFFGTSGRAVVSTVCIMLALLAVSGLIGIAVVRSGTSGGANEPSHGLEEPSRGAGTPPSSAEAPSQPMEAGTDDRQPPREISLDEARKAALADAGLSEAEVTFTKGKLENDGGIRVYDIEFYTSGAEYDYEIDACDGTVYEKETETYAGGDYIGEDGAKEIALAHAGFSETDVRLLRVELEYDHKRAEYEVEFYFGTTEYDYKIDAVSGKILEYEADHD